MKKHLFYCFLSLNLSAMSAQINTLTIQGTVVDSLTQSGIPYVNIGFPAHSIGTSTNELGVFVIKIPQERLEDTLTFSSIGYATVKLAVNDLDKEKKMSVALKATDISLAEFTVKALDANKLLKSFFKNLDKNYATEPALMQLFCRETTKKGDENLYFAQSEGIVEMYKSSVKKQDDHVRLIKGRKKNLSEMYISETERTVKIPEIVNGPTTGIILDIVKSKSFFIQQSNQFKFLHNGYESINDRLNYVVYFTPKDTTMRALGAEDGDFYKGKIFIDTANFAIVRAEFELSQRGINATNIGLMRSNVASLHIRHRKFVVNYTEFNNKWYFKSANVENDYWHKDAQIPLINKLEAFVTRIKVDSVKKFSLKEEIQENESLGNKITNFDDSFWEEYNFIKSVDTLQENTITTSDTATPTPPKKSVNVSENVDNQSNSEVNFIKEDFKTAKKMAAAQRKFIFVDVYTTWCGPCKKMSAEAFHDEEVSELMNTFLINVKADAEGGGRSIAQKYNVKSYPTTLIIDSTGALIAENRGYSNIYGFLNEIESTVALTAVGSLYLTTKRAYLKHKKDINYLITFANLKKRLGMSNESLTNSVIRNLPLDSLKEMHFQQFISNFSSEPDGKTFNFILKNRNFLLFENKLKLLIQKNFNLAVARKDRNLLKRVLKANSKIIENPSELNEKNAQLTKEFDEKTKISSSN